MYNTNIFYEFNGNKINFCSTNVNSNINLYNQISLRENLPINLFKISLNGKFLTVDQSQIENRNDLFLNINLSLPGGKGGFGSMLRAIGAQIEKTTNKEACRDLSGRRLRDVNAEKRFKNWLKRKAEQKKEQARKKKEKLERLTQQPKIDFKDDDYLKEKDIIPQRVDNAIDYVLKKKKTKPTSTITRNEMNKTIDENNRPSTSDSNSNSNDSNNLKDLNNSNKISSNEMNNESKNQIKNESKNEFKHESNDKLINKLTQIDKSLGKRKIDESIVVSKKKKVELWLGDDLDSSDSEE